MSHSYKSGDLTKKRIIEETGKLAAEIGLANVTIGKIAKVSGENKGTIHYHFKGRDNLLKAVIWEIIDSWDKEPVQQIKELLAITPKSKENQAKALKLAVSWQIDELFSENKPAWYRSVLYQGMELPAEFSEMVVNEVFNLHSRVLKNIFRSINSEFSEEDLFIFAATVSAPIFVHAREEKVFAKIFDRESLSNSYIENLKKISIYKILKTFDLPLD